jgi:hypothetical protein
MSFHGFGLYATGTNSETVKPQAAIEAWQGFLSPCHLLLLRRHFVDHSPDKHLRLHGEVGFTILGTTPTVGIAAQIN